MLLVALRNAEAMPSDVEQFVGSMLLAMYRNAMVKEVEPEKVHLKTQDMRSDMDSMDRSTLFT